VTSLWLFVVSLVYWIITTCSVECYWHCSDETVHYKSDKTVNFCGFRCATTSPITVFYTSFFTFIRLYSSNKSLSRQLPPHTTNHFRPVPRFPSFRLTLLGVLAIILTLRHLNQFFDEWMNKNGHCSATETLRPILMTRSVLSIEFYRRDHNDMHSLY